MMSATMNTTKNPILTPSATGTTGTTGGTGGTVPVTPSVGPSPTREQ